MKKIIAMFIIGGMFVVTNGVHAQTPQKRNKQSIEQKARAAAEAKRKEENKKREEAKAEAEAEALKKETEREKEKYLKSDRGYIESNIKEEFNNWQQKGEFEKQTDYERRLKNESKDVFIRICIKQMQRGIDKLNLHGVNFNGGLKVKLSQYDAEKELFPILFEYKGLEWKNWLEIPISNAEEFKRKSFGIEDIKDWDWCFIGNDLFPAKIVLEEEVHGINIDELREHKKRIEGENEVEYRNITYYIFYPPIENKSKIIYSFDALGLDNPHLKGYIFDYSSLKESILTVDIVDPNVHMQFEEQIIKKEKVVEKPFVTVEQMPSFPGGEAEMQKFISNNLRYPLEAQNIGIQGRVTVRFVITKTGAIEDITVIRGIDPACDKEAVRLIQSMPKWISGKQNGIDVPVYFTLAIVFRSIEEV